MKEKISSLSFNEANQFLNFQFPDKTTFEKLEKSFYSLQRRLNTNNWTEKVGNRFSWLFIRDLVELNDIDATLSIVNEIEHLENPEKIGSLTPDAKIYKRGLQGLHYKHYIEGGLKPIKKLYFQPLSQRSKFSSEIKKIFESKLKHSDQKPLNMLLTTYKEQILDHFLLRLGIENEATNKLKKELEEKGKTVRKITGEFFIFYQYKEQNYYLALWRHHNKNEQDDISYEADQLKKAKQIKKSCEREFPEFSGTILSHI